MLKLFFNLRFSYLACLAHRELRFIKHVSFFFEFFLDDFWLNIFLFWFKVDLIHFLLERFELIIKNDFLGFVVKVFINLFDEDFDGFVRGFLHDFEITLVCQGNFIVFLIYIVELEFGRKLLKNILDVVDEGHEGCFVLGVEDVDFFVVYDFEKHKNFLKLII